MSVESRTDAHPPIINISWFFKFESSVSELYHSFSSRHHWTKKKCQCLSPLVMEYFTYYISKKGNKSLPPALLHRSHVVKRREDVEGRCLSGHNTKSTEIWFSNVVFLCQKCRYLKSLRMGMFQLKRVSPTAPAHVFMFSASLSLSPHSNAQRWPPWCTGRRQSSAWRSSTPGGNSRCGIAQGMWN